MSFICVYFTNEDNKRKLYTYFGNQFIFKVYFLLFA